MHRNLQRAIVLIGGLTEEDAVKILEPERSSGIQDGPRDGGSKCSPAQTALGGVEVSLEKITIFCEGCS